MNTYGFNTSLYNIKPLINNPNISYCHIRVLYTGLNRNQTFISQEVAQQMSETLPGTPIVGQFLGEDFGDHGGLEIKEDGSYNYSLETVPYGFIPTDANVWWEEHLDEDGVTRNYLTTEGYLWTGRYPEAKRVIEKGNNQSMELDIKILTGEWTIDDNLGIQYFKIQEACFSALCILGEDVEPCFEGAKIGKPETTKYNLQKDTFKEQMQIFLSDLKYSLQEKKGGEETVGTQTVENTTTSETNEVVNNVVEESATDNQTEEVLHTTEVVFMVEDSNIQDIVTSPIATSDIPAYNLEEVVEYIELSKAHLDLQQKYELASEELENLRATVNEYKKLKDEQTRVQKEEMINKFTMLSEDSLSEIRENIETYTLEEIESKLCVMAVRQQANFSLNAEDDKTETVLTYNINQNMQDDTPSWLKAVDNRIKKY